MAVEKDLGKVTAYAYAKAAGYTGTEEQFQQVFNEFTENAPGLLDRLDDAVADAEAAQAAAQTAVTNANTAKNAAEAAQAAAEQTAQDMDDSVQQITTNKNDISDLKESVNQIEPAVYASFEQKKITDVPIASFDDGADDVSVKKLVVDIELVQSGTGDPSPDNVRPITGWTGAKVSRTGKNLWGGKQLRDDIKAAIPAATIDESLKTVRFSSNTADGKIFCKGPFKENTQYTLLLYGRNTTSSATHVNFRVKYTDGTSNHNINFNTAGTDSYAVFVSAVNKTIKDIEGAFKQGTTLIYYDQSGVFEGVLTAEDFEPYQGETYEIAFPSEAGIVCSGSLDINEDGSGILTVNRIAVSLGERNWGVGSVSNSTLFCPFGGISRNATILCDVYSYYGKVAMSGDVTRNNSIYNFSNYNGFGVRDDRFDVSTQEGIDAFKDYLEDKVACVAVSSPRIYEITSAQVKTLLGTNNIWADIGDISELTYRAMNNTSGMIALTKALIAPVLDSMVADTALEVNDFRIVGDTLYKVTAPIASGGTLTVGTNVAATTIGEQITALLA